MKPSPVVLGLAVAASVLALQAGILYFAVARPLGSALGSEAARAERATREPVAARPAPVRPAYVERIEVVGHPRS